MQCISTFIVLCQKCSRDVSFSIYNISYCLKQWPQIMSNYFSRCKQKIKWYTEMTEITGSEQICHSITGFVNVLLLWAETCVTQNTRKHGPRHVSRWACGSQRPRRGDVNRSNGVMVRTPGNLCGHDGEIDAAYRLSGHAKQAKYSGWWHNPRNYVPMND